MLRNILGTLLTPVVATAQASASTATWPPVPAFGSLASSRLATDLVDVLRNWITHHVPGAQPAEQPLSGVRRTPRRGGRHLFRDEDPLDLDGRGTTLRGHHGMGGTHRGEFAQRIRRPAVVEQIANDNAGTDLELYHALGR